MRNKLKLFLSHSSEDKSVVRHFRSHIPEHIEAWFDEKDLRIGTPFPEELETEVADSDFFIVFVSVNSHKSPWVAREVEWALECQRRNGKEDFITPVFLDNADGELDQFGLKIINGIKLFDHSEAGVQSSTKKFLERLFEVVSYYVAGLRKSSAWYLLHEMQNGVNTYEERVYALNATLGVSVRVIAENQEAFDDFAKAVADYAAYAVGFIDKFSMFTKKMKDYGWSTTDIEDATEFFDYITEEAYHGKIYELNEVREVIILCTDEDTRAKQDIEAADRRKGIILDDIYRVLKEMSRRSVRLFGRLEKNLPNK